VTTLTSTTPGAERRGETAVIWVWEWTVNLAAGLLPKLTDVAVRYWPTIVTVVPPLIDPNLGVMEVMRGGGRMAGGGSWFAWQVENWDVLPLGGSVAVAVMPFPIATAGTVSDQFPVDDTVEPRNRAPSGSLQLGLANTSTLRPVAAVPEIVVDEPADSAERTVGAASLAFPPDVSAMPRPAFAKIELPSMGLPLPKLISTPLDVL
jgi:hypothetical protein